MGEKIIAIVGTYRKNGITDQIVDAVLKAVQEKGAEAEKIYLLDRHIEFCANCRNCNKTDPQARRGPCVLKDDMEELLAKLDSAPGFILASPINYYTVTALMKRFIERTMVYAFWPWEQHMPKSRAGDKSKKAVIITSSACPAFIGRVLMPNARQVLKDTARTMGAKIVKSIYFGGVCLEEKQRLNPNQIKVAEAAGRWLS